MLAGHYAPALLIKARWPAVPLWSLCLAVQVVDIAFFILALSGVEGGVIRPEEDVRLIVTDGVYTHSLLMSVMYGAAVAILGIAAGRRWLGIALGLAVASHWLLDLLVHVPDLPLALSQEPAVGLGLWRWPVASWALEVGLVAGAAWILSRRLPSGAPRTWTLIFTVILLLVQTTSDFVIATPPTIEQLAVSALGVYAGVAVMAWTVDHAYRRAR